MKRPAGVTQADGGGAEVVAEKAEEAGYNYFGVLLAESRLGIEPKVVTKNRVQIRIGITSLRRRLLAEESCLKGESVLDGELAVRDAAFVADAAFVW